MSTLKNLWQWVSDLLGFAVPGEVDANLPKTLSEYRRRREINEQQVAARARCNTPEKMGQ